MVYQFVHWLGGKLFGGARHDPLHSTPTLAFGAFVFGGVLSWLENIGGRLKPLRDRLTNLPL